MSVNQNFNFQENFILGYNHLAEFYIFFFTLFV